MSVLCRPSSGVCLRESLCAIRSFRVGFGRPHSVGETFNQKFFSQGRKLPRAALSGREAASKPRAIRAFCSRQKTHGARNPHFIGISCTSMNCARKELQFAKVAKARSPSVASRARCGARAHARSLAQAKMLVFLSRCSNPSAVLAIPAGTDDSRHSLRLGGQHGEEAKDEDEIGGEEGRAQDKAPEEEVRYLPLQSSTSD